MTDEDKPVILITSGTSKTGAAAATQLLATAKYRVRVNSRDPTKLAGLSDKGAEAVQLNDSPSSASAAFAGVYGAFIVLPSIVGGAESALLHNFLIAAQREGVKHVVYLSAIAPEESTAVHKHSEYEQLLINSGLSFTILRPTFFHENVINYHAESIKKDGVFTTSAGDGVYTSVAVQDIAAVAVTALDDPAKHSGQIYTLTAEAVTEKQLAEILSRVLGKQVSHFNVTPEEHLKILTEKYAASRGATFAAAIVDLDKKKRENLTSVVDPALERVLGRKGVTLEQFFADNASAFR